MTEAIRPDTLVPDETSPGKFRFSRKWLAWAAAAAVVALGLYYPIGMAMVHTIDDAPDFAPAQAAEGGSHAVAMAAALIERETRSHRWVANDPVIFPGWMLDNMPNYQQGIVAALSRFAVEMSDQIGRTRGSSSVDEDLDKAAGLLKYSGTVWVFDPSTSWMPTTPSEKQYGAAERALLAYNQRLIDGNATFDRRADNLMAALDRISKDLGSASAVIDQHIAEHHRALFDFQSDDIFYATKGRLYAYTLLLRELGRDFAPVLAERDLTGAWEQMLDSLRMAGALRPAIVVNGAPDSQFLPSHLATQGFYLLRARTQLGEIADILLK